MTEDIKKKLKVILAIDVLLTWGVLFALIVYGFITAEESSMPKISFVIAFGIGTLIYSVVLKKSKTTAFWVLIFGISATMNKLETIIPILALTQIVSDLITTPLYKKYKQLYIINKELDKRGN